ncbi:MULTISPECIES: CaiB/BaiF CoA transferase family protein [Thalassobaculum]|uniref:CoA:oxalate CoA-transferase n=1 Tax=Thalassobaculum litoreum DSM 18839 TaxID=1123362 RepID=A0A8G2BGE1_9PROT|nr:MULTISPECIES: CoA transferase [Thalassobaculum]SDF14534.1 CoA:oxalate CoA-transferase [Thalassobaculum litoreum DSM 18839]
MAAEQTAAGTSAADKQAGPLSGITVVDLSRILAGPYCTLMMAELGARVIKVETPGTGDDARHYGPFVNGKSAYFQSVNRGKQSIALNLKDDGDRATFEKLLAKADVIVENFRPGTMEKLGYGWEDLHPKYPKLIYASASGFGHSGPEMKRPAYDMVVQGMGGIMSITGHEGSPPTRIGTSIGDIGAGLFTAIGVMSALFGRAMTGEARKVDIGMFDCQVALLENAAMRYFVTGKAPGPLGARHPSITPFQAFNTQDGYIIIAAGNDGLFHKMADALGKPEWKTDDRYTTNDLRATHVTELEAEVEAVLKTQPTAHWMTVMDAAGVPAGPINDIGQAVEYPQTAARNMVVTVDDPVTGPMKVVGNPIKISGFPDPTTRLPAPNLDQDRDAILREIEQ